MGLFSRKPKGELVGLLTIQWKKTGASIDAVQGPRWNGSVESFNRMLGAHTKGEVLISDGHLTANAKLFGDNKPLELDGQGSKLKQIKSLSEFDLGGIESVLGTEDVVAFEGTVDLGMPNRHIILVIKKDKLNEVKNIL